MFYRAIAFVSAEAGLVHAIHFITAGRSADARPVGETYCITAGISTEIRPIDATCSIIPIGDTTSWHDPLGKDRHLNGEAVFTIGLPKHSPILRRRRVMQPC